MLDFGTELSSDLQSYHKSRLDSALICTYTRSESLMLRGRRQQVCVCLHRWTNAGPCKQAVHFCKLATMLQIVASNVQFRPWDQVTKVKLFDVLRNITWRNVSALHALHVHVTLPLFSFCTPEKVQLEMPA